MPDAADTQLPEAGYGKIAGMTDYRVVGMDVFRNAWVAVALTGQGYSGAYLASSIEGLLAQAGPTDVVAIDIPIGLPISSFRPADHQARGFIGPRWRSVFLTPVRAAVVEENYPRALALSREHAGQGMSRQAHSLRQKILEVDEWLGRVPQRCLVEAHPEVSFKAMADRYLLTTKKSWDGAIERRNLLRTHGIELPDFLGNAGRAGTDDVLDAAAVAWTARRVALGLAVSLPSGVPAIPAVTRQTIWY